MEEKNMNKFKKIIMSFAIFTLFTSLVSCGEGKVVRPTNLEGDITVYALNDFHGAYAESSSAAGMSRIGNYLINKKTQNPDNTFVISSGDMWQGTADSNLNKGKLITECMNAIGFDSMTIGNHEFDWDESVIEENEQLMDFPLLACNIFKAETTERPDYLKPYTIIDKGDYRLGVIGAVKENMGTSILRSISDKFDFPNPIKYIKECSDVLFGEEDCDAVILSTHDGDHTVYSSLNSVSPITNHTYVDGIFLAHDHSVQNGTIGDIPYVEGGANGAKISSISLHIKRENDVSKVSDALGQTISTLNSCLGQSDAVNTVYAKYETEINAVKEEVVGFSPKFLTRTAVAQAASEAIVHYINENQDEFKHKVNYACINNGGARANIYGGKVTYGMLISALPFDNFITLCKLTQAQLDYYLLDTSSKMGYTSGDIVKDADGYYYIGTIDYLAQIMDTKLNNTETYTSTAVIRDVLKDEISKNNVTNLVPYTGQADPTDDLDEPPMVESTIDDFVASTDEDFAYKYHLTAILDSWDGSNTDGTQYGDFYLRSLTTNTKLFIYGCSGTEGCIAYSGGDYYFKKKYDFLTNEKTKNLKIGDKVEVQLIRQVYKGIIEGFAYLVGLAA